MTLNELIKDLQRIRKMNPRKHLDVVVDTGKIKAKCNGVFDICNVDKVEIDYIELADGDGFGLDKQKRCVVLK